MGGPCTCVWAVLFQKANCASDFERTPLESARLVSRVPPPPRSTIPRAGEEGAELSAPGCRLVHIIGR